MRVQVKYPGGEPHEVELPGRVSIIGRDPTCDLVVHDVKCSRRHAVLEAGPDGVTVRDSGSANGVFVNGQRVERAVLRPGDMVALGEVQIVLLPESPAMEATLMAPAGAPPGQAPPLPRFGPAPPPAPMAAPVPPAPPPPPPPAAPPATVRAAASPPTPPRPRGSYSLSGSTESGKVRAADLASDVAAEARAAGTERPLTVTLLSVLWMASVLLYSATGIGGLVAAGGLGGAVSIVIGGFMAIVSAAMAVGLWKVQPWARIAQIVIAALGVLTCSFTLPSVATLVYMLRSGVRARFANGRGPGDSHEGLFTGLILGTVILGVLLAATGWALMAFARIGDMRVE